MADDWIRDSILMVSLYLSLSLPGQSVFPSTPSHPFLVYYPTHHCQWRHRISSLPPSLSSSHSSNVSHCARNCRWCCRHHIHTPSPHCLSLHAVSGGLSLSPPTPVWRLSLRTSPLIRLFPSLSLSSHTKPLTCFLYIVCVSRV